MQLPLLILVPALLTSSQDPSGSLRQEIRRPAEGPLPPRTGLIERPDHQGPREEWDEDEERRDWVESILPSQAQLSATLAANGLLPAPGSSLGPPMAQSGGWECIGPRGAMDLVGGNGRLEDIQFVGTATDIDVVVAGICGVWRMRLSTWTEWEDLSAGLPSYGVGAINVDPSDPRWIVAGLGCRSGKGQGIYVRTPNPADPAGPWVWTRGIYETSGWPSKVTPTGSVLLDPKFIWRIARSGSSTLTAATDFGLIRSLDNGETWSFRLAPTGGSAGGFSDVIVDPSNTNTLWACEYRPADQTAPDGTIITTQGEIWRTDNASATSAGEASWTRIGDLALHAGIASPPKKSGDPPPVKPWQRAKLSVCSSQPDVLVVLAANPDGWAAAYRSTDARSAAPSWTDISGVGGHKDYPGYWTMGGFPNNNMCVAVSPTDPDDIHVGMVYYWRKKPGASWGKVGDGWSVAGHADFTALRFTPAFVSTALFVLNDGGAYWVDVDTNATCSMAGNATTGISAGNIYEVVADRGHVWATLQDNGVIGSLDSGTTWLQIENGDGGSVEFSDPARHDIVYSSGVDWYRYYRLGDGTKGLLSGTETVDWWPWPSYHHRSEQLLMTVDGSQPLGVWDTSVSPPVLAESLDSLHDDLTADASSISINTPGTGYSEDDVLTMSGGAARSGAFKIKVKTVDPADGSILTFALSDGGYYQSVPDNPVVMNSSSGSGCTLNLGWKRGWGMTRVEVSPVGDLASAYVTFKPGYTHQDGDLLVLRQTSSGEWTRTLRENIAPGSAWIARVSPSWMWPDEAWIAVGNASLGAPKVYRTSDFASGELEDVSGNLADLVRHVNDVISVPFFPDRLFAATEIGVYSSTNGGVSWNLEPGLPKGIIQDLHIDLDYTGTEESAIYAATYSQGVFRKPLSIPAIVFVDHTTTSAVEDGSFEDPFSTVIAAVAAAPDGAVVAVRTGTYAAPVLAERAVTIVTWAGSTVIR